MGFWPFSGNKRQRSQDLKGHLHEKSQQSFQSDNMARMEKGGPPMSGTGTQSTKDDKTRKASKNRASLSTLGTSGQQARSFTAPVTSSKRESNPGQKPIDKELYQHTPLSQSSLGPENFSVVSQPPTLYARRSDYSSSVPRRKSSKRKAEDYAREREVRAMSSSPIPIPKRPATYYGGGMMQRDTKELPGDLNKKLKRPSSHVSLPIPETLPSVDEVPNQSSFKIGTLAALSPRPTLKYESNPRNAPGKRAVREKPAIKQTIVEEPVDEQQRINELADDLDAGGLRELMEKDRRRREKKKEQDRLKLQRKLQRRAEKQKEDEARKARTEDYVRSTTSVEKVHDVEPHSPTKHTDTAREEAESSSKRDRPDTDPFRDPEPSAPPKTPVNIRNPFEDEQEADIMQEGSPRSDEGREPIIPVRSPLRNAPRVAKEVEDQPAPTSISPPVSPAHEHTDGQSVSQASFLNREETPEASGSATLERKPSDQSSQRLSLWTNFFRRGTSRQTNSSFRGRDTPSEFSNTSRESFARKQQQPPQPPSAVVPRSYRRSDSSATPQRTMSKFREDLPELPISPPDSRVQSPETSELPALSAVSQTERKDAASSLGEPGPAESSMEHSSPVSGHLSRTDPKTPTDLDLAAENTAANAPISQSLASVDSEASWLSGKPIKRLSGQGSPSQLRKSQSSLRRHTPGTYDDDNEGVVDDDFLNRLSPAPGDRRVSVDTAGRKASSTLMNLQDEGTGTAPAEQPKTTSRAEEPYHIHASIGRQPTVVRQAGRARSKEGLLQSYTADAPENEVETENELDVESPGAEISEAQLMRAKSVDYKGHARQISAGSARLLDIRRASQHSEAGSKGPLSPKMPKHEMESEAVESNKPAQ